MKIAHCIFLALPRHGVLAIAVIVLGCMVAPQPAAAQSEQPGVSLLDRDDLFGDEPQAEATDSAADAFARCLHDSTNTLACATAGSSEGGLESFGGGLETVILDVDDEDPDGISVQRTGVDGEPEKAGMAMIEMDIFFDYNSTAIRAGEAGKIQELASALKHPVNAKNGFLLIGHTDARGSETYNCRLSRGRAESVVAALAGHGIATDRLVAVGAGERVLKVPDAPLSERNRRVGLAMLDGKGAGVLARVMRLCH